MNIQRVKSGAMDTIARRVSYLQKLCMVLLGEDRVRCYQLYTEVGYMRYASDSAVKLGSHNSIALP